MHRLGFRDLEHDSHVRFDRHLTGTYELLCKWGERRALCDAGLFHSAYGTEYFGLDRPADRDDVRNVIGSDAEEIVWLWCTIERDSLDAVQGTVINRYTGDPIQLSRRRVVDVATLWAADTVEQIGRLEPRERTFAAGLSRVLRCASEPARAAIEALTPPLTRRRQ